MLWALLWSIALSSIFAGALDATKTLAHTAGNSSNVVTTQDGKFFVNGSEFRFVGTNAYWLQALNTEEDIINTFKTIRAANITVVRTWAFNDVDVIPENGTWFQLIANGTTTINNGTNGLQKLDAVIRQAELFGIYLMLTLTNNWNPRPLFDNITTALENLTATVESPTLSRRDVTLGTNNSLPRNFLSNDYGGMDVYVRQFGLTNHDDFFTNETVITAFENFTTNVVSRYIGSPAVLAWEIANDPRCNSSVAASAKCNTTTVTSWLSRVAQHVKSVDPTHLVTSGAQGFLCSNCTKLFPTPSPTASPAPGRRNFIRRTKEKIKEIGAQRKKRSLAARPVDSRGGTRIRGKWAAPPTKRQSSAGVGPAFDGSQGVDSEDIINIPQIGFGTFQLFPDQNMYGPNDPNLPSFNNTITNGIDWIKQQAAIGQLFGKPVTLTGFGLVTQENAPFFVPFNTSIAPFGPNSATPATSQPYGVTDQQRDDAYTQWLDAGIANELQGILQYQWGQSNLTAVDGTTISPVVNSTTESPNVGETGQSPNDGYSIQGVGEPQVVGVIQNATQQIGPASG